MDTQIKPQHWRASALTLLAVASVSCAAPSFARGWAQEHPRRAEVLGRDNRMMNRINNDRGNLSGQYDQLRLEDHEIRAQEQAEARANGGYLTRGEQHQLNREENSLNRQIRNDYNPNQQFGSSPHQPGYPIVGHPGGFPGNGYPGGAFPGHPINPVGQIPVGAIPGHPGYPGHVIPVGFPSNPMPMPGGIGSYPIGGPGAGNFVLNHPRRAEVLNRDAALNQEIQADHGNLSGHYGQLVHEDRNIRRQEQRDARANGGYITPGEQAHFNHEENRIQHQINRDFY